MLKDNFDLSFDARAHFRNGPAFDFATGLDQHVRVAIACNDISNAQGLVTDVMK